MSDDICECGRCGRMHRKLGNPRPEWVGALSHEDLCALSRLVGEHMSLHVNQPGYRINEWLKRQIAEARSATNSKDSGSPEPHQTLCPPPLSKE